MLLSYMVFCAGWALGAWISHKTISPKNVDEVISQLLAVGVFAIYFYLKTQAA